MSKPLVIVTGKNGQLGQELKLQSEAAEIFDFLFTGSGQLDITDNNALADLFDKHRPRYFVNCAAYTAVDKAETEQDKAYLVNAEAVGRIAAQCRLHNCTLITISTDYVFNGKGTAPYRPADATEPVNYYGYTKLMGEKLALENNPATIVIRSSWVYSPFGHNFVKTMLRLMSDQKEIAVVDDQRGSPTYAYDLAQAILAILASLDDGNTAYGIYHYSNTGMISWFDFANAVAGLIKTSCVLKPIATAAYPTPARRPAYSVLDCSSTEKTFGISAPHWKESLVACLQRLGKTMP
ncbi:MAG: dTDP-4-dehydrorhamnose reductase [Chitinophagaceae bacterium]|nr:dTDP-4-dehydrorhamnose reductase [Chitinophagaceae bacterium]